MSEEEPVVFCQQWEESERGWGVRPDGYSVHLSLEDAKAYIGAYWDRMPPPPPPDEYSRPCGKPYACHVLPDIYQQLLKKQKEVSADELEKRCGVRFYDNKYPEKIEGCQSRRAWEPVNPKKFA